MWRFRPCMVLIWLSPVGLSFLKDPRLRDVPRDAYNIESVSDRKHDLGDQLSDQEQLRGDRKAKDDLEHRAIFGKNSAYKDANARGCRLANYILDPSTAPQTPFTSYTDLADWGWSVEASHDSIRRVLTPTLRPILDELGLSQDQSDNIRVEWSHSRPSVHGNGVVYRATGGSYKEVYNPSQGVIYAFSNFGPEYHIKQWQNWPSNAPPPKLKNWSDVVGLSWNETAGPHQARKLRYIFRLSVVNDRTREIISDALQKDGVKNGLPPKWPGHTFRVSNRNGRGAGPFHAVLGSPNVAGTAWLLIQHQELFRGRTITAVTVWDKTVTPNYVANFCILVSIGDLL